MSRPGLKYVSPGESSIPAVNSGRWNRATNYAVDFAKVLGEVGIEPSDTDTVELFLRYVAGGRFLCAAKRKRRKNSSERTYEALWMFIPDNCDLSPRELTDIIEQLPLIFGHKEAFMSQEGFEDILPGVFFEKKKEVVNPEKPALVEEPVMEQRSEMALEFGRSDKVSPIQEGWRVGYVNLECREDLETVLGCGYKRQYDNFGLILLCDNPVRVESILPRIFLPELTLNRQMRDLREKPVTEEDSLVDKNEDDSQEVEPADPVSREEPDVSASEERVEEDLPVEVSEETHSGGEYLESGRSEEATFLQEAGLSIESESAEVSGLPSESGLKRENDLSNASLLKADHVENGWKLDYISFGIGFFVASALFLIIMLFR